MKKTVLTVENSRGTITIWQDESKTEAAFGVTAEYSAYPFPIEVDGLELSEAMTFSEDLPVRESAEWDSLSEDT